MRVLWVIGFLVTWSSLGCTAEGVGTNLVAFGLDQEVLKERYVVTLSGTNLSGRLCVNEICIYRWRHSRFA
ncbi:MAG: hypothetical protein AAFY60_01675, partial [Myxococcota bacterium]